MHPLQLNTLYQKGGQHSVYMQPRSRGLGVFPRMQKCSLNICWALTGPLSVVSVKCTMSLGIGVFFGAFFVFWCVFWWHPTTAIFLAGFVFSSVVICLN